MEHVKVRWNTYIYIAMIIENIDLINKYRIYNI